MKSTPFSCEHIGCNIKFKTKRQKLLHHNSVEKECKDEKDSLVDFILKFKGGLSHLVTTFDLDQKKVEKLDDYKKAVGEFEETAKKLYDSDYFVKTLGESFVVEKISTVMDKAKIE